MQLMSEEMTVRNPNAMCLRVQKWTLIAGGWKCGEARMQDIQNEAWSDQFGRRSTLSVPELVEGPGAPSMWLETGPPGPPEPARDKHSSHNFFGEPRQRGIIQFAYRVHVME